MRGNSHVRFLGGWKVATPSGYPVAERQRWAAARSVAVWPGTEKKETLHDRARRHAPCPHSQRLTASPYQARRQVQPATVVVLLPEPPGGPVRAEGVLRALAGVRSQRGGRSPRQRRGRYRALADTGSHAPAWGRRRVTGIAGKVSAWSGGAVSGALGWSACRVR